VNPNDTVALLRRIAAYSPTMPITDDTPPAWWDLLGDIDLAEALAAVRAHYAATHTWITPADIRRHAARTAGVLPPDPPAALAQARRWLDWRGPAGSPRPRRGEPELHPATRAACDALGWAFLSDAPDGVVQARWREAYAPAAADAERRALAPGGIAAARAAVAAARVRGLPEPTAPACAPDPQPGTAAAPAPAEPDPARLAELRGRLARTAAAKAPPAPRADYPPPTEADRDRWSAAFRAWAEANGHPLGEPA
jgi:hypothetical protein